MSKLAEVFNVEVPSEDKTEQTSLLIQDSKEAEDADFDFTRGNQYELIMQGRAAIGTAMKIASECEEPRAIEVLSGLLKTVSDMNAQLLKLSKDKADIKVVKKSAGIRGPQQPLLSDNSDAVYTGTSTNLNKLLKSND